jgi:hypothetical protein
MEDKWEEVKSNQGIWLPTKAGEEIEGAIIGLEQNQYGIQARIETKTGELITPSHKVLQARLRECKIGDYIRIVFVKEELPTIKGRQGTKIYNILKKVMDAPVEKI